MPKEAIKPTRHMKLSANGKRIGRPTDFNETIANAICDRIAGGESLRTICKDDSMPVMSAILRWLDKHAEFEAQYARARARQMEAMAEEIIEISDSADVESYNPARLQVDTRKWLMSKLAPKKYGERTNVQLTDGEGGPVTFTVKSILDASPASPALPTTRLLEGPEPPEHSVQPQSREE